MDKEVEDIEFDELLAEKRHRELKKNLGDIANALSKPKEDAKVSEAIEKSSQATVQLVQAIKELPKPQKPEVNVNFDHNSFVASMSKIADRIEQSNKTVVKALNDKPMATQFNVEYDYGNLRTVKIVYTTADKLTFKK